MAVTLEALLADLAAESHKLDDLLSGLDTADWDLPTPAEGWAIRDQVSHLAFFDQAAGKSATDPDAFRAQAAELLAIGATFPDEVAVEYRGMPAAELLGWFRAARQDLINVFGGLDPKARVPWYGPDMSVLSSATARLMETWAHGQDVFDAVGATREPSIRLRHVAHLGVRTFGFTYQLRGLAVPETPVRVELDAPDGTKWTWGDDGLADVVAGPAEDFCLVVTQRRNVADTRLRVTGPVAGEWMSIAQAFAGMPGPGRKPGEVSRK
jgi:uncharacterized protein (TIGR03084 family)